MKRTFQVATVFTGAVACAATLAPTADAATVAPDTTARNCTLGTLNAVHLYYSANAKHPVPACVSGTGYISFPGGKRFAGICGGAWSGTFYYGVPGTSIAGSSYFVPGHYPVKWRQTDIIYGVDLVRYVSPMMSCTSYLS